MSRFARRVDKSQHAIVKALRAAGAFVEPRLSRVGGGVSDLLVAYRGAWYVLELKTPGNEKKHSAAEMRKQVAWLLGVKVVGQIAVPVVRTPVEALEAIGAPIWQVDDVKDGEI